MMRLATVSAAVLFGSSALVSASSPYPQSSAITGITWHLQTALPQGEGSNPAFGSDQFRCTWADDDRLYVAWGDGGGFGGSNTSGRVSLGVGRITGTPTDWSGQNVWGGINDLSTQSNITGKGGGVLSIGSTLYVWAEKADTWDWSRILRSSDHGLTWNIGSFVLTAGLETFTPIQFGKAYAGVPANLTGYVYGYFREERSQGLALARVPTNQIESAASYQYFAGLVGGQSTWSSNLGSAVVVFADAVNGVNWGWGPTYLISQHKFILTVTHGGDDGMGPGLGVFEADQPWGPWHTVYFSAQWLDPLNKFTVQFNNKWANPDGTGWVMYSGWPEYDGYFHIAYTMQLGNGGDTCAAGETIPAETHNLVAAADKFTYSWSQASDATAYAVVRGKLAALPVGSSAGGEACFDSLSAPVLVDTQIPVPGAGSWYLSQSRNACGVGPLGTQSNGTTRVTTVCP